MKTTWLRGVTQYVLFAALALCLPACRMCCDPCADATGRGGFAPSDQLRGIDAPQAVSLPNTPFTKATLKNKTGSGYRIASAKVRGHDGAATPVYQFAPPPPGTYTNFYYPLGPIAQGAEAVWCDDTNCADSVTSDICQTTRKVEFEFVVENVVGTTPRTYGFTVASGVSCPSGDCRLRLVTAVFQGINASVQASVALTFTYYTVDDTINCGSSGSNCSTKSTVLTLTAVP